MMVSVSKMFVFSKTFLQKIKSDYDEFLNSVQRHTKYNSGYCLRIKKDKQTCRFKFY